LYATWPVAARKKHARRAQWLGPVAADMAKKKRSGFFLDIDYLKKNPDPFSHHC
jgi:hypothetical protein